MPDTKLSALTEATTLGATDELYANDSGTSKRITVTNLGTVLVTSSTVTAAGALMDSELTSLSGVKTLTVPDSTTISAFGATLVDDADAAAARTTLGVDAAGTDNSTDVTLSYGTSPILDYLTIDGQVISVNAIDLAADVTGTLPASNIDASIITGQAADSPAAAAAGDLLLIADVSASPVSLKHVTAQSIADLASVASIEGTSVLSTGPVTDGYVLTADGAGGAAWKAAAGGGGAFTADAQTQITPTTPIVLDEATGDEVALDLSATINKATSGNYSLIYADVTENSAPGTADYLINLKVGGTAQFTVNNSGHIELAPASRINSLNNLSLRASGTTRLAVFNSAPYARILDSLGITNGSFDTQAILTYDAANTLALRNSTNAQTFRVYSTYTDASNRENLAITGNAITVETAGTGADDIDLTLTPAGAGVLKFGTHSAIGAETVTGYITIKDSSGTTRKLAVVS